MNVGTSVEFVLDLGMSVEDNNLSPKIHTPIHQEVHQNGWHLASSYGNSIFKSELPAP
jgi:hypothetical protein